MSKTKNKFSPEARERAVRMVGQAVQRSGVEGAAVPFRRILSPQSILAHNLLRFALYCAIILHPTEICSSVYRLFFNSMLLLHQKLHSRKVLIQTEGRNGDDVIAGIKHRGWKVAPLTDITFAVISEAVNQGEIVMMGLRSSGRSHFIRHTTRERRVLARLFTFLIRSRSRSRKCHCLRCGLEPERKGVGRYERDVIHRRCRDNMRSTWPGLIPPAVNICAMDLGIQAICETVNGS